MKKTLTVNLGGIVFNIDEDAFAILKSYLDTIKGYFDTSEGRDEIMTDIESRIAEMLQEKLNAGKQVINSTDINEVIVIMGQPEDYITEDLDEEPKQTYYSREQSQAYSSPNRRLYRDTDGSVVGGVCSGLGYYFGIDPLWIRLAFVIAALFFGTGPLLYIILWIIIPAAKFPSEKLAMKGEPVTFDNIGKTVEEEIKNVKKKLNNLDENHVREHRDNFHSFVSRVAEFVLTVLKFSLKAIGKILGFIFIFIGGILLFSLIFGTFAPINNVFFDSNDNVVGYNIMEISNVLFTSGTDFWMSILGMILFIGIPFLALLLAGLTLLFNLKTPKYTGLAMAGAWVLGIILITIGGVSTLMDFKKESEVAQVITFNEMTSDTLYLEVLDHQNMIQRPKRNKIANDFFKLRDGVLTVDGIDVDILKSNGSQTEVEVIRVAKGKSFPIADQRAELIEFYTEQDSTSFKLDPYFSFNVEQKWRNQEVNVNIYLPVGKSVFIPNSYKYLLDDVDNYHNTNDKKMVNHYWTMTDSGLVSPSFFGKKGMNRSEEYEVIHELEVLERLDDIDEVSSEIDSKGNIRITIKSDEE